jgi:hypothetical protein
LDGIHHKTQVVSLCAHAILQDQVLEIHDAQTDPCLAANPLVTGAPGIRLYAGAPLTSLGGQIVGALCMIDTQPKHMTKGRCCAICRRLPVISWTLAVGLTTCNAGFAAKLGLQIEVLSLETLSTFVHPVDLPGLIASRQRHRDGTSPNLGA